MLQYNKDSGIIYFFYFSSSSPQVSRWRRSIFLLRGFLNQSDRILTSILYLWVLALDFLIWRGIFEPRRNIFVSLVHLYCVHFATFKGIQPPSKSRNKKYVSTIFIILQHREPASLKTFPAPLGALKRKRVRLKTRGRFSTLYFYRGGLYFDSKRRTA